MPKDTKKPSQTFPQDILDKVADSINDGLKEIMSENAAARPKPRDAAWRKRRDMLFPDGRIKKTHDETPDQFVGRLRELEDGMDPFHPNRRNHIMDDWHYTTQPTISLETPVEGWRDERDQELWTLYTNRRFETDTSFQASLKLGRRLAAGGETDDE